MAERTYNFIDLTDQRFGRLVAMSYAGAERWYCACDCGGTTCSRGGHLRSGKARSCGCLRGENSGARGKEQLRTHGCTGTPEHTAWIEMRRRCRDRKHHAWPDYGGRDIAVCDLWERSFEAFLAHIGPRPGEGYSLDRIDNDGDYEPGNVRWATQAMQNANRRPAAQWRSRQKRQPDAVVTHR